jgi:hypothetical protein
MVSGNYWQSVVCPVGSLLIIGSQHESPKEKGLNK